MRCPKCRFDNSLRAQVLTWRVLTQTGKLGPLENRSQILGVSQTVPVKCGHCGHEGVADDFEEGVFR